MFDKLKKLLENSYAPYSAFKVASIIKTKSKKEYFGVNVESAAFSNTMCAERNAIFSAISSGIKWGDITEIHLLAFSEKKKNQNEFATPCGSCRQIISESSNNKALIYIYNLKGEIKKTTIEKLLPDNFNDKDF
ncbi:/ cdd / Cytidine deaminase /:120247 Forward [Candidatus Hepatoplasma crinochetorum]|uniref:Cytidine deaminase n=1 Tax=Candidatus Hepatoplasma crinochetorum TaxID=295596 RepID=A0A0G7ZM33_9MOLU|nr:/ cdd / Cytidine deaminase /:120247 Forward [Candidatus Hepatoplasma crinochetorum]